MNCYSVEAEIEIYDIYQRRIIECGRALAEHLKKFADKVPQRTHQEELKSG